MKIVITNESGLTDSHLEVLRDLGEVQAYADTNASNVEERLKAADVAVIDCFLTPVTKKLLSSLPNLKFLTVNSTGYDNVDVEAVRAAGITASNVPGFSTEAVAELAIGLMFAAVRKISEGDKDFRESQLQGDPGTPAAKKYLGFDLRGKVLGVVGLGNIGARVAEISGSVGMQVIGYNRTPKVLPNVKMMTLDELLGKADVICICLALTDETKGLISKEKIKIMKRGAVLISIASMEIVDVEALKEALDNGALAGAGLDTAGSSMFTTKNTILTPHMAWNTRESNENMGKIIMENVQGFIAGKPINTIS